MKDQVSHSLAIELSGISGGRYPNPNERAIARHGNGVKVVILRARIEPSPVKPHYTRNSILGFHLDIGGVTGLLLSG